jgi:hypothetical protein
MAIAGKPERHTPRSISTTPHPQSHRMHKPIEKGANVTSTAKHPSRTGRPLLSAIVGSLALATATLLFVSSAPAAAPSPALETLAPPSFAASTSPLVGSNTTQGPNGPTVGEIQVRNVTGSSAYASFGIATHGSQTAWRLELAASASGPWTAVPGASGIISQAQAEADPYNIVGGRATGLNHASVYYLRVVAENTCEQACGATTSEVTSFETSGVASASAFKIHALHGESLGLLGSVDSASSPTSAEQVITLEGAPTGGTFALELDGHSTTGAHRHGDRERRT